MSQVGAGMREQVRARAGGRCEYCLEPEDLAFARHQVDHVIAEKHGGQTVLENLALCCTLCNRRKGSDLSTLDPVYGELRALFHPRRDRWADHFELRGGEIVPLTSTGRVTVKLLRLNRPDRIKEREALVRSGRLWTRGGHDE
jgi:hypothetical protein